MTEQDMPDNARSASWREVIPDDEAEQFGALVAEMKRYQSGFARRGDGQSHRGFHVKSHAGLRAEFRVLDDIPPAAKHGVFREARTFQAWVRLSNGFSATRPDWFPDLLGCAVKLQGVEGLPLLAGTKPAGIQDFLALNHLYIPAADARELSIMSMSAANVLLAPLTLIRGLGAARALRIMLWTLRWTPRRLLLRSVATEDFYSLSPITIGPHAVKFTWQSRQRTAAKRTSGESCRNYLRDELKQRLAESDIRYDFLVQFYVDPEKTPIDGAYEWKPDDAPFVKLAELTILRCDLETPEARRQEAHLAGLSFNPWQAVAEHRPIGNIQRARRMIYRGSVRDSGREEGPGS
jgi:hypothetical protein